MSVHKSYAVFGLGRYGMAVAKGLMNSGADVLAVDLDETIVNSAIIDLPYCKCADVTDPEVIKQLGIGNIDVVIIAMSTNLEASVLAIMLCKEAGVQTVIAKCATEIDGRIMAKVGADQVVFPELESGARLARNLLSSGFVDVIELSNEVSLVEMNVKPEWVGKSLIEAELRKKHDLNVIAVRRKGNLEINVNPHMKLETDMELIVIASVAKLNKLI